MPNADFITIGLYIFVFCFNWFALWSFFAKTNTPPAYSLIPVYNLVCLYRIAGRSAWWLLAWLFPPLSAIAWLILCLGLATAFQKSGRFTLGLFFFPLFVFPILAFDSSQYQYKKNHYEDLLDA